MKIAQCIYNWETNSHWELLFLVTQKWACSKLNALSLWSNTSLSTSQKRHCDTFWTELVFHCCRSLSLIATPCGEAPCFPCLALPEVCVKQSEVSLVNGKPIHVVKGQAGSRRPQQFQAPLPTETPPTRLSLQRCIRAHPSWPGARLLCCWESSMAHPRLQTPPWCEPAPRWSAGPGRPSKWC